VFGCICSQTAITLHTLCYVITCMSVHLTKNTRLNMTFLSRNCCSVYVSVVLNQLELRHKADNCRVPHNKADNCRVPHNTKLNFPMLRTAEKNLPASLWLKRTKFKKFSAGKGGAQLANVDLPTKRMPTCKRSSCQPTNKRIIHRSFESHDFAHFTSPHSLKTLQNQFCKK
jgi:hypothetical protein